MKLIELINDSTLTETFKIHILTPKEYPKKVNIRISRYLEPMELCIGNLANVYDHYCIQVSRELLINEEFAVDYTILLGKEVLSKIFKAPSLETIVWIELTNKEMEEFFNEA